MHDEDGPLDVVDERRRVERVGELEEPGCGFGIRPLALHARESALPRRVRARVEYSGWRVKSHTLTSPCSGQQVISRRPSELKRTPSTAAVWPRKMIRNTPELTFQTRAVASLPP